MSRESFDRTKVDCLLADLEGWGDVLFCMSLAQEIPPNAIRMVSTMMERGVRELREATGLGPARPENRPCA